jgi:hypothetical protein
MTCWCVLANSLDIYIAVARFWVNDYVSFCDQTRKLYWKFFERLLPNSQI